MANILKKYTKSGVITTGEDNLEIDTPSFEIIDVRIDTVNQLLKVEIVHEVSQGSVTQKHSRTFEVSFSCLPSSVKKSGKAFLDAVETEILALPQYNGSTEV